MKRKGYVLYDTLMAITLILIFSVPLSKAANITEINIRNYQDNQDLNERTEVWVSRILSKDYMLEAQEYIILDENFCIHIVSAETQYADIKKISMSVEYNDESGSHVRNYKNSAEIYKYIGETK